MLQKTPSPLKRPPADLEAPPPPAKKRRKRKPKGPLIDTTTQIPSPRRILEPETVIYLITFNEYTYCTYRIYSIKHHGAYLILVFFGAALIQGRRLFGGGV